MKTTWRGSVLQELMKIFHFFIASAESSMKQFPFISPARFLYSTMEPLKKIPSFFGCVLSGTHENLFTSLQYFLLPCLLAVHVSETLLHA
jgi:hypothetical protein